MNIFNESENKNSFLIIKNRQKIFPKKYIIKPWIDFKGQKTELYSIKNIKEKVEQVVYLIHCCHKDSIFYFFELSLISKLKYSKCK